MKIQHIKCKSCGCVRQENVHFLTGKRGYTNRFSRLVVELSHIGTIQDVGRFLHLSWDTVKDIQKRYLQRHYANPNIRGLEYIGIDEFAVAKGHHYKTIVVNLINGQVIYVGDGKGADALDAFWKKVKKEESKKGKMYDKGRGNGFVSSVYFFGDVSCSKCYFSI